MTPLARTMPSLASAFVFVPNARFIEGSFVENKKLPNLLKTPNRLHQCRYFDSASRARRPPIVTKRNLLENPCHHSGTTLAEDSFERIEPIRHAWRLTLRKV